MSDELRQRLRLLELDYLSQPVVVQRVDLPEINRLRAQLGLPAVNARLEEQGAVASPAPVEVAAAPPAPDHSRARAIYEASLVKLEVLKRHQAYAQRVAQATSGAGQTPVAPLATMGRGGGPLLCDFCEKPIVLEGGSSHGLPADEAWAKHPKPTKAWHSWILGGLVVELAVNGTLRIFHGYPGGPRTHCCNAVLARDKKAREAWEKTKTPPPLAELSAFLAHEFPALSPGERAALLTRTVDLLFSFDPGVGVNVPDE